MTSGSKARKDAEAPKEWPVTIDDVERALVLAFRRPLPGVEAQLRMAPSPRLDWDPHRMPEGLREGAALLLVYPARDERAPHVLLTVRGADLRRHTGQVSFPGGAVDRDESVEAAALREASEEVGLDPSAVRVLGPLTPLHIPVSGYVLHPIVGIANDRPTFAAHEHEVARLLEVPISEFEDARLQKREQRTREHDGRSYRIDYPYFDIAGEKVWGATAMALAEFLAMLRRG